MYLKIILILYFKTEFRPLCSSHKNKLATTTKHSSNLQPWWVMRKIACFGTVEMANGQVECHRRQNAKSRLEFLHMHVHATALSDQWNGFWAAFCSTRLLLLAASSNFCQFLCFYSQTAWWWRCCICCMPYMQSNASTLCLTIPYCFWMHRFFFQKSCVFLHRLIGVTACVCVFWRE